MAVVVLVTLWRFTLVMVAVSTMVAVAVIVDNRTCSVVRV